MRRLGGGELGRRDAELQVAAESVDQVQVVGRQALGLPRGAVDIDQRLGLVLGGLGQAGADSRREKALVLGLPGE